MSSDMKQSIQKFIDRQEVGDQLDKNEEFLRRRSDSWANFYHEIEILRPHMQSTNYTPATSSGSGYFHPPPSLMYSQSLPATSLRLTGYPISHDASFYRYGGFCNAPECYEKGQIALKATKEPGV
jgi:hypothetical protein